MEVDDNSYQYKCVKYKMCIIIGSSLYYSQIYRLIGTFTHLQTPIKLLNNNKQNFFDYDGFIVDNTSKIHTE